MNKNVLALAYLGDSVYELYVRTYLLECGLEHVKELQKEAVKFVSASSQEKYLKQMLENSFLNEKEIEIVYRGRNHKVNHKPKNASMVTYKNSTGLETLIGTLFLEGKEERIHQIMNYILRGE